MTEYFPKSTRLRRNYIQGELNLSNYATKADIKKRNRC